MSVKKKIARKKFKVARPPCVFCKEWKQHMLDCPYNKAAQSLNRRVLSRTRVLESRDAE